MYPIAVVDKRSVLAIHKKHSNSRTIANRTCTRRDRIRRKYRCCSIIELRHIRCHSLSWKALAVSVAHKAADSQSLPAHHFRRCYVSGTRPAIQCRRLFVCLKSILTSNRKRMSALKDILLLRLFIRIDLNEAVLPCTYLLL